MDQPKPLKPSYNCISRKIVQKLEVDKNQVTITQRGTFFFSPYQQLYSKQQIHTKRINLMCQSNQKPALCTHYSEAIKSPDSPAFSFQSFTTQTNNAKHINEKGKIYDSTCQSRAFTCTHILQIVSKHTSYELCATSCSIFTFLSKNSFRFHYSPQNHKLVRQNHNQTNPINQNITKF